MSKLAGLLVHNINLTVRIVRGYRYLDLCGKALIRLEQELGPEWVTGEATPQKGSIHAASRGFFAEFDASRMTLVQQDFEDLNEFKAAAQTVYDVLVHVFELSEIHMAVLRVQLQRPFESSEQADHHLLNLGLVAPREDFFASIGGQPALLHLTACTDDPTQFNGTDANRRRRFQIRGVRQQRRPFVDERAIVRARALPRNQREALRAIAAMKHREIPPAAAEFDFQQALEFNATDAKTFDLSDFIDDSWSWTEEAAKKLSH